MIRKWMTVLTALLLTLMLPLCALADVQHTLTLVAGDAVAAEPAIADLLKVIALTYTQGTESGQLTFTMGEKDIASVGLKTDATGMYVQSSLLSSGVYYVTWEDGIAVLTDLLKEGLEAEGALDAATSEAIDAAMAQMKDAMISGASAAPQTVVTTPEQAIAMVEAMYPDDPGMKEYIQTVYSRMTVEKGLFINEKRDAASEKYTMTMTEEDVISIFETKYMRSVMEQVLVMENPDLQGAELTAAVDEMIREAREELENCDLDLQMNVYTVDGGMTLTGMEMTMAMTADGTAVTMTIDFNRLTDANGVNYHAALTMGEDGQEMARMQFELLRGADDVTTGSFAMLADGAEMTVIYHASNDANVRTRKFDLYFREGAAGIVPPAASDRPLFGLVITTSPADPAVLSALEEADSTTAQDVMQMSEAEWNELAGQIELKAMTALYAILGELPSSTMSLVQEMMQ